MSKRGNECLEGKKVSNNIRKEHSAHEWSKLYKFKHFDLDHLLNPHNIFGVVLSYFDIALVQSVGQ